MSHDDGDTVTIFLNTETWEWLDTHRHQMAPPPCWDPDAVPTMFTEPPLPTWETMLFVQMFEDKTYVEHIKKKGMREHSTHVMTCTTVWGDEEEPLKKENSAPPPLLLLEDEPMTLFDPPLPIFDTELPVQTELRTICQTILVKQCWGRGRRTTTATCSAEFRE